MLLHTDHGMRVHVVEWGETLGSLVKRYYGIAPNAHMVGYIWQHNRQQIDNPNQIYPGQRLMIPYPPANLGLL